MFWITVLDQVFEQSQDGLLRRLKFPVCVKIGQYDILLSFFALKVLIDFRHVLHVNQIADLLVVQNVLDIYLNELCFFVLMGVRIRIFNLIDYL